MVAKEKSAARREPTAPPKPSRRSIVVYDIMRTASSIRRAYASLFEPHGLTLPQYNILRILRGAGRQGLPTLEIAERTIEETPGITRLLDRLEAKHLIRRERPASNRRQVLCYVTRKGLDLLRELDQPLRNRVASTVRRLTDADVEVLQLALQRIREDR